jgi:hypothetical protein
MKNFWAVIILLAVLLGLGFYFSSHTVENPPVEEPVATSTGTITATVSKSHIEDKENKFKADIETPIISGHANAQVFNDLAKVYVDRATEEFSRNAAEANFNIPDEFKNESHGFIAQAKVSVIADRYVSVIFAREYDMLAAAHPFHLKESLNYDLEAKKVIELSDIFSNVDQALEYVSAKSAEQIKTELGKFDGENSFIAGGVAPEEANFRIYAISETGITFLFAEYQVAPYAAGPQSAVFTWADLRPLLTPQFKLLAE